jgi:hypothetical protein
MLLHLELLVYYVSDALRRYEALLASKSLTSRQQQQQKAARAQTHRPHTAQAC